MENQIHKSPTRVEAEHLTQNESLVLASLGEGVYGIDRDGHCSFINSAALSMLGFEKDKVIGVHQHMLFHHSHPDGSPYPRSECPIYLTLKDGIPRESEDAFIRENGEFFPVRLTATPIRQGDDTVGAVVVFKDITKQRAAAKHIHYLNLIYAALAQTNQAIVRCHDEVTLFVEICRIAVEFGGMKMSWIGRSDEESGLLRTVASYGSGTEYLDCIVVSTHVEVPEARGPSGTAFRENHPVIVQDFRDDEHTRPWQKCALLYGWRASAAFPITRAGRPYAVLSVYHTDNDAFDQKLVDLLSEMATNISYALDRFDLAAERAAAEAQQREAQQRLKDIIDFLPDATFVIDKNGTVIAWNKAIEVMTGIRAQDMIGKGNYEYALPFYGDRHPILIDLALSFDEDRAKQYPSIFWKQGDVLYGESYTLNLPAGKAYVCGTASILRNSRGEVIAAIESIRDITEQKAAEEQIQRLAYFDPLTGLPNRTLLSERAGQAINMAQSVNEPLVLMFLDLDHFKNINDTLGHRIGDELLIKVAERVKSLLREQDIVSRLGGDEFILLLAGTNADGAAHMAGKLLQRIALPYYIEEHELTITPSIGIAMYPTDGKDLETLYKYADIALHHTKQGGRNSYRFFTPEMQQRSARQLQLENALRRALEREELMLHYQPQVSLESERIIGVEALLRWQHPEFGMVPPAEFIPLAEESGLILPIGEWVLHTAIRQMKTWLEAGFTPMTVAVNLSAIQLRQHNLSQLVTQILDDAKLPAEYLELELTESAAMKNPEMASAIMDSLHERGVRIAIDDFGTGYSSLAYLKRFQIHKLKIDQSFVRKIASDPEDEAIVSAIISIAKSLHLRTIAEGVEDERQLQFLRERGCEEVQGYYFSPPLPADALQDWILSNNSV